MRRPRASGRRALALALIGVAGAGSAAMAAGALIGATGAAVVPAPPTGGPLVEPSSVSSRDGLLRMTMPIEPTTFRVGERTVTAPLFAGRFVPPTLRVRPGDKVRLTLVSRFGQPTNFHFHGFNVSPKGHGDNVLISVPPHSTYRVAIDIPEDHPTGLFWYHPHLHPLVEQQVFGGMSGAIVVEGLERRLPGLAGIRQRILALKDIQVTDAGRIPRNIDSDAPTVRTVNGQVNPTIAMRPGEVQLWRIANVGADIWYHVRLQRHALRRVAVDGNPLRRTETLRDVLLPPGKRAEVLVRASRRPGEYRLLTLPYSTGPQGDSYPQRTLARLVVSGPPARARPIPGPIATIPDLREATVARRRTLVFSENPAGTSFFIDGRKFSHRRIDQRVRLGTVEEWTVRNVSGEQHPFHIHQGDFQVTAVNGVPVPFRGVEDVVPLPVGGSVTFRMRFRFAGTFVYHCHILAHEDAGMMGTVRVS